MEEYNGRVDMTVAVWDIEGQLIILAITVFMAHRYRLSSKSQRLITSHKHNKLSHYLITEL